MLYTTRLGERDSQAHINYVCPCGCVAGLTYDRATGSEHLGRCCCGRLLWVGPEAEDRIRAAATPGGTYEIDEDTVTLPWGDTAVAVLAAPVFEHTKGESPAATLVRDVVCNMRIDPSTAAATSVYEGVAYYFCATGCKQRFDANPLRYLAQEA